MGLYLISACESKLEADSFQYLYAKHSFQDMWRNKKMKLLFCNRYNLQKIWCVQIQRKSFSFIL